MAEPTLSPNGQWLLATLHQGRGVKPPPGLGGGDSLVSVSVDHVMVIGDFYYLEEAEGPRCKATNLLLANGQWLTICGDPSQVATLLGYFDDAQEASQ